jgi:hypothetical protein
MRLAVERCFMVLGFVGLFTISAGATDLTIFGGMQKAGDFSVSTAQSGGTELIRNFDPKTFGVFGLRIGHGKVLGGEYTTAYAPNFVDSNSHAWIVHGNLRAQIPIKVLKPYATGGIGFVNSSGNSVTSLGTEFLFNYGGGINLTFGPIGANFDVRGYTLPSVHVAGFTIQENLNFVQATAGIVFVIH